MTVLPKSIINLLEDVAPASNSLGAASDMGQRMHDMMYEIAELEDLLKEKKSKLLRLQTIDLPDLMQETNLKDFRLNNGEQVVIREYVKASIPSNSAIDKQKDPDVKADMEVRQQQCFEWLRDNKAGHMIKNKVEVSFDKKEDAKCQEFTTELRDKGVQYNQSVGVHTGTLDAHFAVMLSEGKDIPMDTFKIYVGRKAVFTPESKKGSKNGK